MSLKKRKFEDKEVDKKEFYSSKQAIPLDSVDLDKIVNGKLMKQHRNTYVDIQIMMLFNHYVLF